jgi:hypothetical protein
MPQQTSKFFVFQIYEKQRQMDFSPTKKDKDFTSLVNIGKKRECLENTLNLDEHANFDFTSVMRVAFFKCFNYRRYSL